MANNVVGIDEVGRGCWAGPLVAAAVVLDTPVNGLKDSKVLTRISRQLLAGDIKRQALAIGLGWVSARKVDELGLTKAIRLAMQQALDDITVEYEQIIIDGNYNFMPGNPKVSTLVRADSLIPAVSAASIIAKETRDAYMVEAATKYKEYGFDKHVGYGTRLHHEKLKLHGVCELHRLSYKPVRAVAGKAVVL